MSGQIGWQKAATLKITGLLRMGKNAAMKVDNADGTTTNVNIGNLTNAVQELTATGAVTAGVQRLTLNHASTIIASTIADAKKHAGFFCVLNNSASGTAAHKVTLTAGTFNGTNNIATLNAPNEMLLVHFDEAGNGVVVLNTGSVALS